MKMNRSQILRLLCMGLTLASFGTYAMEKSEEEEKEEAQLPKSINIRKANDDFVFYMLSKRNPLEERKLHQYLYEIIPGYCIFPGSDNEIHKNELFKRAFQGIEQNSPCLAQFTNVFVSILKGDTRSLDFLMRKFSLIHRQHHGMDQESKNSYHEKLAPQIYIAFSENIPNRLEVLRVLKHHHVNLCEYNEYLQTTPLGALIKNGSLEEIQFLVEKCRCSVDAKTPAKTQEHTIITKVPDSKLLTCASNKTLGANAETTPFESTVTHFMIHQSGKYKTLFLYLLEHTNDNKFLSQLIDNNAMSKVLQDNEILTHIAIRKLQIDQLRKTQKHEAKEQTKLAKTKKKKVDRTRRHSVDPKKLKQKAKKEQQKKEQARQPKRRERPLSTDEAALQHLREREKLLSEEEPVLIGTEEDPLTVVEIEGRRYPNNEEEEPSEECTDEEKNDPKTRKNCIVQ
jgi:hypothetical protein